MNKNREDQINFIKKIKPFLYSNLVRHDFQETTQIPSHNDKKVFESTKLDELIKRIEKIERCFDNNRQLESVRKRKVKEKIISLLKQNKKLSSSELKKLIGLSRTRCNEYFRELTKEGKTEGIIIGREKYYKLVKKWRD